MSKRGNLSCMLCMPKFLIHLVTHSCLYRGPRRSGIFIEGSVTRFNTACAHNIPSDMLPAENGAQNEGAFSVPEVASSTYKTAWPWTTQQTPVTAALRHYMCNPHLQLNTCYIIWHINAWQQDWLTRLIVETPLFETRFEIPWTFWIPARLAAASYIRMMYIKASSDDTAKH